MNKNKEDRDSDNEFELELEEYNKITTLLKENKDKDLEDFLFYDLQTGGNEKKDIEKEKEKEKRNAELDKLNNDELTYEERLFKQALRNYQGTDSEKYLLNKYIEYTFKKRNEDEEGLYLISTNINTIIEMIRDNFVDNIENIKYPGKYKNKEEEIKEEELMKLREVMKNKKQEYEESKSYYERFNEYVDENYEEVLKNIIGINKDISNSILQPELVFNEQSTFETILEESRKYQFTKTDINLKALYHMVKLLFKKKKSLYQWLRISSLCETIYIYFNDGKSREVFFESIEPLDINLLLDLEEFWKTDFIFRGNFEKNSFRNQLDFYK